MVASMVPSLPGIAPCSIEPDTIGGVSPGLRPDRRHNQHFGREYPEQAQFSPPSNAGPISPHHGLRGNGSGMHGFSGSPFVRAPSKLSSEERRHTALPRTDHGELIQRTAKNSLSDRSM